ncbi:GMP synthase [glutamine-hydrolyzing] [Halomonas sp. THAF5a]|uniref:glutamine amidotransferase n=1 Tax=Halomonas sp. THAF5a TaxID=2587844 RepID=UPI001268E79F|nr:glutamine amidotransferase [Halomonas sp. THAF5a]QFU00773.1 GMP synthase [glutamine-hydrolyzing] [Halomonas sp. THAF5a]
MPRLTILKTGDSFADVVRDHGDFEDLFLAALAPLAEARDALTLTVHDARHEGVPPVPAAGDGVVITGSHAMVSDAEPWSEALKPWLVEARARGVAMLGVCYGHQLMAAAFGGVSGYHPAGREVGTRRLRLTEAGQTDPLFGALPATFTAQLTHSQSVLTAPPGAQVLADNDHDPFQALRHGPRQWSVQFHPEFSPPVMRAYLAHQRAALADQGDDPEARLDAVTPTPEAGALIARFAEQLVRPASVA